MEADELYKQRIKEVCKEILENPNQRNKAAYERMNCVLSYHDSIMNCFENSELYFPHIDKPVIIGFQRVEVLEFNIWMAMADGLENEVRMLARFGAKACHFFSDCVAPMYVMGSARVHESFKEGLSFLRHWGFKPQEYNGSLITMARMFGG